MGVKNNASYHAMHVEDVRGIKAGGFVIWDGGLGIGCAERAGCVPVGGKSGLIGQGWRKRLRIASMYPVIESS